MFLSAVLGVAGVLVLVVIDVALERRMEKRLRSYFEKDPPA